MDLIQNFETFSTRGKSQLLQGGSQIASTSHPRRKTVELFSNDRNSKWRTRTRPVCRDRFLRLSAGRQIAGYPSEIHSTHTLYVLEKLWWDGDAHEPGRAG